MAEAVQSIMEKERTLREKPMGETALLRTDRIHRAEGIARYATMLSSEEFFSLFADLKLGVALGVIEGITDEKLSEMLVAVQPATLSMVGEGLEKETERDIARGALVRDILKDVKVVYS
jgi:protein arginine kinase